MTCACGHPEDNRAFHGENTCWLWNRGSETNIDKFGFDWKRQADLGVKSYDQLVSEHREESLKARIAALSGDIDKISYNGPARDSYCKFKSSCLFWGTGIPHTWCISRRDSLFRWVQIKRDPKLALVNAKWFITKRFQVARWWLALKINNAAWYVSKGKYTWFVKIAWAVCDLLRKPESSSTNEI
jgi:hypothetical protein